MRKRWRLMIGIGLTVAVLAAVSVRAIVCRRDTWRPPDALRYYRDVRELWPGYGFLRPDTKLLTGWYAAIRPTGTTVFLSAGGRTRPIRGSMDLVGHVQVRSRADALDYVGFFALYGLPLGQSGVRWQEVKHASTLQQPDFVDAGWGVGKRHRRLKGWLLDEEWQANGLADPVVAEAKDGFEVTRWLWTLEKPKGTASALPAGALAYRVSHRVLPDGRIHESILETKELKGVEFAVIPRM